MIDEKYIIKEFSVFNDIKFYWGSKYASSPILTARYWFCRNNILSFTSFDPTPQVTKINIYLQFSL